MAAELAEHFPDQQISLVPSAGGRFEVLQDGVAVFRKSELHRHAEPGEIVALLRSSR